MFHSGSGEGEEDVDFNVTSTSSTKLASLFSFESPKEQSLTYTAPKQPKKPEEQKSTGGTSSSSSVLCAVVVHAYKFENQQYASQGKLGAAIIANHDAPSYKLILYKGKQQHVTFATINLSFNLKVQPNKYASFYDDQRESWSILFDSEQNGVDFAKQIALAKANSAGANLNNVVVQDLTSGDEGNGLELGDSAEVKYSGWLLQNHAIGQLFDSNNGSEKLMKIKLGKTKIIKGWEEGMIGVKKNQKRLIVIPPNLGYGNQQVPDKVPANSTLIFELCVTKVKSAKDSSRSATPNSSQDKQESLYVKKSETLKTEQLISNVSLGPDDSVKARGASISEQLSQQSPKTEKAKIISRMAKMGMPMLPMQGSPVVHQSSESETEDDMVKRRSLTSSPSARASSPKPIIKPRPINPSLSSHPETHSVHQAIPPNTVPHQQLAVFQQHYPNPAGMPYAYSFQPQQPMAAMFTHPVAPPPQPSLNDTHLPLLMSENRTQNSEVRMVLSKIGDKVDMVLNKLDQVKSNQVPNQSMMPYMDSTALVQNIERIVQENSKWKHDLEEKNQKIHTLNEKICVLLEKNQKLVEESNYIMEKRSDTFQSSSVQSQSRLVTLESEKLKISEELTEALSQITELKLRLAKTQNETQTKLENLSDNSEKYQGKLEKLQKELQEKNVLLRQLEDNLEKAENSKTSLTSKLEILETQLKNAEKSSESLSKNLENNKEELLKKREESEEEIIRLKAKYEEEIDILKKKISDEVAKQSEKNNDHWNDEKKQLENEISNLKQQISGLQAQKGELELKLSSQNVTPTTTTSWENKLKRGMTALYRSLQQEIENGASYEGEEVLQLVLQSIRTVTSALLESEVTQSAAVKEELNNAVQKTEEKVEEKQQEVNVDVEKTSVDESTLVNNEIPNQDEIDSPQVTQETTVEDSKGKIEDVPTVAEKTSTEPKITLPISSEVPKASTKIESLLQSPLSPSLDADDPKKKYLFFDTKTKTWRPQPPPPPLFDDDDEDEDDWLKN